MQNPSTNDTPPRGRTTPRTIGVLAAVVSLLSGLLLIGATPGTAAQIVPAPPPPTPTVPTPPAAAAPTPPQPTDPDAPKSSRSGPQARQAPPEDGCGELRRRIERTPLDERRSGATSCVTETRPRETTPEPNKARKTDPGLVAAAQVADPLDTNTTCQFAYDYYDGGVFYTRTDSCFVGSQIIEYVESRTGRILGRITLDVTFLNFATTGTSWSGQAYLRVASADPIMAGTTLSMRPTCAGSCTASGGFVNRDIGTFGAVIEAVPAYTMTGFTNSQGFGSTTWTGTITNPPGSLTPTLPAEFDGANPPQMRCDQGGRGVRNAGCVYPAYTPTLVYSRTNNGQLGQHIADAQATGLPGAFGGTPLTRLNTLLDDSNDNRTLACPDRFRRPTGPNGVTLDCDEYPFASSQQGAASTNGTGGRTFSYCQIPGLPQTVSGPAGYSACMIDRTANRSGGGQLSSFYARERVLWDDAYHVDVDP